MVPLLHFLCGMKGYQNVTAGGWYELIENGIKKA